MKERGSKEEVEAEWELASRCDEWVSERVRERVAVGRDSRALGLKTNGGETTGDEEGDRETAVSRAAKGKD